ncbi:MAG TPA: AAA family ATPase [Polyangiaceae bacterium]|nr:AAA family ATPase [Polyangiaceae bacterium]
MPPASDPRTPFPVRGIHGVEPRSSEQRWLVDQLFAHSSVGLLGGPAKAFKTWVAAELALAVATGTPAFGRFAAPDPGPVVFFGAEDPPPDLRLRFDGIARARGLDLAKAPLLLLDVAQLRLDDQVHLRRLHGTVARHKPRLLVLDPFVRLVAGLDENSARDVSAVLGALRTLQREHEVTVLLVHHMRKSPAAHPAQQLRGSGDFSAWLDSGLYLTRHGDDRILVVEHRSAPAPSPFRLRLVPGDTPHLEIQDAHPGDAPDTAVDPLHARVVERLHSTSRPQSTFALRDALRVRKADLLAALHALEGRRLVTKTQLGWMLASDSE